jgi:Domain of unknown function (DUF2828)
MASLVAALDKHTDLELGENGTPQLDWSNDMQERITQFYFQCVRCPTESGLQELATVLDDLLTRLLNTVFTKEQEVLLIRLYKLIAQTRDVEGGKGEYALAYMMIWQWYKYFPDLAKFALQHFVVSEDSARVPYGSWKDIKYMCKYVLNMDKTNSGVQHPLIQYALRLLNEQLAKDDATYLGLGTGQDENRSSNNISLAAKWVPRETSNKFGILYETLATDYFKHFICTAKTAESKERAVNKCKAQYRMLLSKLNRHLDTVQIKQAGGKWCDIDHAKTTSITMQRQRKAFLNMNRPINSDPTEDRIQCASNLREYLDKLKTEGKEVKGKKVGLEKFAEDARRLVGVSCQMVENAGATMEERGILDSQWRDNSSTNGALGNFIAMCDTSGSMEGDPMNAAIALACRVAEKSSLGKRVMTFSASPEWIDMDHCSTFTEMVSAILHSGFSAGYNTDFYRALDMILAVIEKNRIPATECENMVLAIFSDMQIDSNLAMMNGHEPIYSFQDTNVSVSESYLANARSNWKTLYQTIQQKYHDVGIRLYGVPIKPPHILFWNLRKTSGFPSLSTQENTSMMSGFDAGVLNLFCEHGFDALRGLNSAKMLDRILSVGRYDVMEQAIKEFLG